MRAWNWNVTDSKKNIFDLIIRREVLDMTVQRNVPQFCTGSICGWNLFLLLGQMYAYKEIIHNETLINERHLPLTVLYSNDYDINN